MLSALSVRGLRARLRSDLTVAPVASTSPSRSWRTTGQDSSSFVNPTQAAFPGTGGRKHIAPRYISVVERVDHAPQLRTLRAQRVVDPAQALLPVRREREVDDAAVARRRRAANETGLLGPLHELGDRALGERELRH